jgi:hypothetical protein
MTRDDEELLTAMEAQRETGLWQGWDRTVTEAQARHLFQAKYGAEPAVVRIDGGGAFAGPVPEKEKAE